MKESLLFDEEEKEKGGYGQQRLVDQSHLLDRSVGRLASNIGYHYPQDPAVYAEEKETGYPQPRHKS
jgi:hypothetical protein